jgi:hypothetical protein
LKQNGETVRIDEGMQIALSDEHEENVDLPSVEILQPLSNVTLARFSHPLKQNLEIVSIDEGMKIERSDRQCSNVDSPTIENPRPSLTSASVPKYRTSEISAESTRKSPHILKKRFTGSSAIPASRTLLLTDQSTGEERPE